MSPFDRVLAVSQLLLLIMWEALGVFVFGWPALDIAALWFVGLVSFNTLTATAVRTYFKLISPGATVNNNIVVEAEEDIGG